MNQEIIHEPSMIEQVKGTLFGYFVYALGGVATLAIPIVAFVQIMDQNAVMEDAVLGAGLSLLATVIAVRVIYFATYLLIKIGALYALSALNVFLAIDAFENTAKDHLHVSLWCEIAQLLRVHYQPIEWICTIISIIGWISISKRL